jgi:predicted HicB family RNase H-like nuclease
MKKTETLNLRVSPEFKRRLMHEAAREKRSITNYLEVVLAEFWRREEVRQTPPDEKRKR